MKFDELLRLKIRYNIYIKKNPFWVCCPSLHLPTNSPLKSISFWNKIGYNLFKRCLDVTPLFSNSWSFPRWCWFAIQDFYRTKLLFNHICSPLYSLSLSISFSSFSLSFNFDFYSNIDNFWTWLLDDFDKTHNLLTWKRHWHTSSMDLGKIAGHPFERTSWRSLLISSLVRCGQPSNRQPLGTPQGSLQCSIQPDSLKDLFWVLNCSWGILKISTTKAPISLRAPKTVNSLPLKLRADRGKEYVQNLLHLSEWPSPIVT